MNKTLILIILFLAAISVDAQTLVGFQGYYTKAKLSTDTTKLNRMQTLESGYGGGVSFKHFELGPLGLQFELNYEKSGFGFHNDTSNHENPVELDYRQDLSYVSIPMLMQLDIGKHTVHFVGALGPYLNILLSAPEPETNMQTVMQNGFSKMVTADFNRFTYGLMGEAGVAIATNMGVFQITARANIGMSKLLRFDGIALFNYTLPKTFGIGLNYYVPFGEEKYKQERQPKDTIVSDLEVLSDSLNAASDTLSVDKPDKSSKKSKKEKVKKDKKSKSEQPVADEPEQSVSDEQEQPVTDETESKPSDNNTDNTDNTDNGTE
ncbi:MAG: PorT family protein [Bacteroidales bacterium]|nr:PorT family protein [Bacteroidales bacterium]